MQQYRKLTNRHAPTIRDSGGANDLPMIVGYAAVFYNPADPDTQYEMYNGIIERIVPGAFDQAIREDDVCALFDHDESLILGRTSAGTCRLSADRIGLRYEIDPPNTQVARDLIESIRRGDICGSSFSFVPREGGSTNAWDGDSPICTLTNVKLFDVSPVAIPAYKGTSAGLRGSFDPRSQAAVDRDRITVELALIELDADSDSDIDPGCERDLADVVAMLRATAAETDTSSRIDDLAEIRSLVEHSRPLKKARGKKRRYQYASDANVDFNTWG